MRSLRAYGLIGASLAWLVHAGSTTAQQWEELGPPGGLVYFVAAGPAGSGKVYALGGYSGPRMFASADNSASWTERPPPPGCPSPTSLQVRSDGDVFVNCNRVRNLRSHDDARSWSLYGRSDPRIVDGPLMFDPRAPSRAAVYRYDSALRVAFTADDGLTWTSPIAQNTAFVPSLMAWDPLQQGRLVAVGTEALFVNSHSEYLTRYFESRDNGAHWSPVAVVVPQRPDRGPCYEREFVVDPAGRAYLIADCGFLRSLDGGNTWDVTSGVVGSQLTRLGVDPANGNRLLSLSTTGQLYESRDVAASWQLLPQAPAPLVDYAASTSGQLFATTTDGVFRLDTPGGSWLPRNTGLHARALGAVEPAGDTSVVLSGLDGPYRPTTNFRSLDGGQTWTTVSFDNRVVTEFVRNLTVRSSIFALTADSALYASTDGGAVWTQVNAHATSSAGEQIAGVVPIGPQPGIVYGLSQTCDESGFLGCFWQSHGVARSTDGGRTWVPTGGIAAPFIHRLVVSPANPDLAMVETASGLWVTRDGGVHWEQRLQAYSRVLADPVDPARWYAMDEAKIIVTTDGGVHWSTLTDPPVLSTSFDLLVDPHDTRRLYLVGSYGDVSVSTDRGMTWQTIVAPSLTLALAQNSARIGPEAATTIYAAAAQGALKVVAGTATTPAVLRAIEYYRPSLDHYFVTANAEEISRLDSGALAGWVRTGFWFNVLAPATPAAADASAVCRFYGKPEKGLDSHFYSASPAECQAVRDRFSDAWIYESPAVFSVYLPAYTDGSCPDRTTPVYRLYNNRPDVNHRYTMWPELREIMLAASWLSEGYGVNGVAMCVPW